MRALKIIAINVAIFIFIIFAIEISVRLFVPKIAPFGISKNIFQAKRFGNSMGLTPNIEGISAGAKVITNNLGFRVESTRPRQAHRHNIVVLGDSVSFGVGVTADKTFPFLLEKKLNNYGILNTSVIGYWVEDYFNVLSHAIQSGLNFDLIIISICLNDVYSYSQQIIAGNLEGIENKRYPNRFLRLLKHISDSYIDFNALLREYSRSYLLIKSLATDSSKNYFLADLQAFNISDTIKNFSDKLKNINDLAANNGKQILFFICPYEYQLRQKNINNSVILKPQKIISDIAIKEHLYIVDLLPYFKIYLDKSGLKSNALFIFDDAMHFSIVGHQVAAQAIYEEMSNKMNLKKDH